MDGCRLFLNIVEPEIKKQQFSEHYIKSLKNLVTPEIHVSVGKGHWFVVDHCLPSKHCQLLFWPAISKSLHTAPP